MYYCFTWRYASEKEGGTWGWVRRAGDMTAGIDWWKMERWVGRCEWVLKWVNLEQFDGVRGVNLKGDL